MNVTEFWLVVEPAASFVVAELRESFPKTHWSSEVAEGAEAERKRLGAVARSRRFESIYLSAYWYRPCYIYIYVISLKYP